MAETNNQEPIVLGNEFEVPTVEYGDPSLNLRLQVHTKIALMGLKEFVWSQDTNETMSRRKKYVGIAAGTVAAGACIGAAVYGGTHHDVVAQTAAQAPEMNRTYGSITKYPLNIGAQIVLSGIEHTFHGPKAQTAVAASKAWVAGDALRKGIPLLSRFQAL